MNNRVSTLTLQAILHFPLSFRYLASSPLLLTWLIHLSLENFSLGVSKLLISPKDLSGNLRDELLRLSLMKDRHLTPERIDELLPPYPKDAPTVVSWEALREVNYSSSSRRSFDVHEESILLENVRLEKELSKANLKEKKPLWEPPEHLFPLIARSIEASNNWVVSGKKTTTGKPLLANDPHLQLTSPSIWYLSHLETPEWTFIGASLALLPGVFIGRNQYFVWGDTNVGTDIQGNDTLWSFKNEMFTSSTKILTIRIIIGLKE